LDPLIIWEDHPGQERSEISTPLGKESLADTTYCIGKPDLPKQLAALLNPDQVKLMRKKLIEKAAEKKKS